jgi:hypothetical protein
MTNLCSMLNTEILARSLQWLLSLKRYFFIPVKEIKVFGSAVAIIIFTLQTSLVHDIFKE